MAGVNRNHVTGRQRSPHQVVKPTIQAPPSVAETIQPINVPAPAIVEPTPTPVPPIVNTFVEPKPQT